MTHRSRAVLVLALSSLLALAVTQSAFASHVHPGVATPMNLSLVPAFTPCTTPDSTHGTPLSVGSCSGPTQVSTYLTTGTPDVNGLAATGQGAVKLRVFCNAAYPYAASNPTHPTQISGNQPPCGGIAGDNEDVSIEVCSGGKCTFPTGASAGSTQTLCKIGTGAGTPCAAGALTPYSGIVVGSATIRITDHYNTVTAGAPCNPNCAGTVQDLPFSVGAQCSAGNCKYLTTADAVVPDTVKEGKSANVEVGQLQIYDGGANGDGLSNPFNPGHCPPACVPDLAGGAGIYAVQGLYLP